MTALTAGLCLLLGLAVGSFLNVVIWRVPRGESVVTPPSHCPGCDTPLSNRDNVPVLSWLALRGRCRACRTSISVRYPVVELTTGLLWLGLGLRFAGSSARLALLPSALWLGALGVALAAIDLDTRRLPDRLTLPAYPVSLALLAAATPAQNDGAAPLLRALAAAALCWLVFFGLCVGTAGKGMGFGDVKLVGVLGLHLGFLGWRVVAVGIFTSFLLGAVVGVGLMVTGRAGRRSRIPFGPFLIAGALVGLLAGAEVGRAWLGA